MCCALLRIVAWPCPALCFGPRPTLTAAGSSWQQLTSAVWAIALRTSPAATPKTEDVAMFESKTTSISAHLFPKGNINIIEHHWTSLNIMEYHESQTWNAAFDTWDLWIHRTFQLSNRLTGGSSVMWYSNFRATCQAKDEPPDVRIETTNLLDSW